MPVRLGAAAQQTFRLGAAPVSKMYLGAQVVYSPTSDPPPPPNPSLQPPTLVSVAAGNTTATIEYIPRTTYTIVGHLVQQSTDNGLSWSNSTGTLSPSPAIVGSLTNGTPYRFRVATQTSQGVSGWSDPSAAVTPVGAPGAPTNISLNGTTLSWVAPADLGGATPEQVTYIIQRGTGTAPTIAYSLYDTVALRTNFQVPVSCSTGYWWRVAASTAGGQSAYSSAVYAAPSTAVQPPVLASYPNVDLHPMALGLAVAWQGISFAEGQCTDPTHYEVWYRERRGPLDNAIALNDGCVLAGTREVNAGEPYVYYVYEFDIVGLDPSKEYLAAVRAVNSAGATPLVQGYRSYAGAATLPPRPSGIEVHPYMSGAMAVVPSRAGMPDTVEYTLGNHTGQWLDERYGYPERIEPCTSDTRFVAEYCAQTCDCADNILCAARPYYVIFGNYTLARARYISSAGAGPPAHFHLQHSCNATPPRVIDYVRGGKQSARIITLPTYHALSCVQGGYDPRAGVFNTLTEYRPATIDADGFVRGSGAWVAVDKPVDSFDVRFAAALPTDSLLEVRVRDESGTPSVLGAPSLPVAVRTFSSGATLYPSIRNTLGATGSVLFDDPSSWTQPVEAPPMSQAAYSRYIEVQRACIISLTVTAPTVASPSATRRVRIVAHNTSGVALGVCASKSLAGATPSRRISFYARPNRLYTVEVTDPDAATTAISQCWAEDHYDQNQWTGGGGGNPICLFTAPLLRADTITNPFALGTGFQNALGKLVTPESPLLSEQLWTATNDDGTGRYFFRALTDVRIHLRVVRTSNGILNVHLGRTAGTNNHIIGSCGLNNADSGHIERGVPRGYVVSISGNGATGTLQYAYGEIGPYQPTNAGYDEFDSLDAIGYGGYDAAAQNGLE